MLKPAYGKLLRSCRSSRLLSSGDNTHQALPQVPVGRHRMMASPRPPPGPRAQTPLHPLLGL